MFQNGESIKMARGQGGKERERKGGRAGGNCFYLEKEMGQNMHYSFKLSTLVY